MIITALNESISNETRVAITPNAVKHYLKSGFEVICEKNAGLASGFHDADYTGAGASIESNRKALLNKTKVLVCVNEPSPQDIKGLAAHALVIAPVDNEPKSDLFNWACKEKISVFSMNFIPRISRAQSMDSLSSQANLAGYRAVIEGVSHFNRAVPMMMTAAGMIQPAKVLILGAGVAGLQAIATAKRLGAVIEASDVRPSVKEQVESLGAKFIDVPYETQEEKDAAEGVGGYARPMPQSWLDRQKAEVAKRVAAADIVITTALIPGRPAPVLVTEEMVAAMKPGSVIVDLAASQGGNCPLTQAGAVVQAHGVTLVGETNLPALVAADASALYARNVLDFLKLLFDKDGRFALNLEDDIVKACLVAHEGELLRT